MHPWEVIFLLEIIQLSFSQNLHDIVVTFLPNCTVIFFSIRNYHVTFTINIFTYDILSHFKPWKKIKITKHWCSWDTVTILLSQFKMWPNACTILHQNGHRARGRWIPWSWRDNVMNNVHTTCSMQMTHSELNLAVTSGGVVGDMGGAEGARSVSRWSGLWGAEGGLTNHVSWGEESRLKYTRSLLK